MDKTANCLVG